MRRFSNAVATTDAYYQLQLKHGGGWRPSGAFGCGIVQSGGSGSYTYAVAAADQNFPVNYVSFWDAARFCNWLQNGQPEPAFGGRARRKPGTTPLNGYNGAVWARPITPQRGGHVVSFPAETNGTRRRITMRPTPATGFTPRRATRRRSTSSLRRARTTPTFTMHTARGTAATPIR